MATDPRLKDRLPALTDRIVGTYERCGGINHLGHSCLPSYREVTEILADLREILYPGFGRRQRLSMRNVGYHVGDLVDSLYDRLSDQICRALVRLECDGDDADPVEEHAGRAQRIALSFLESLPELRGVLADDVAAAFDGDPAAKAYDEIIFCYPGVAAITIYRIANLLHSIGVPLIPRMMTEYAHSKTGIDLHPGATIGRRFFIDHGTGVVIGETTRIGDNVKVYQGVTLGALSFPKDENGVILRDRKRHPTIEDDVVIYANATILGGDTVIGHHAVIGSSVWLTRSVEPFTTVTIESPRLRYRAPQPDELPEDAAASP
ncbi:serine O-acetyltransferase [Tautonia plasticadhaerens]|uniref:Serine acetyltransferase n=1 Tax=Tautonia plasticadhaerens TaxID=2527974 RepID=A0A518GYH6_9BACT|nr:serine acetyltransferase [Tautonia plasticadhaerens]QDV33646.1 Serine acetyltransferase [Tautonia plasticadhaerens]